MVFVGHTWSFKKKGTRGWSAASTLAILMAECVRSISLYPSSGFSFCPSIPGR